MIKAKVTSKGQITIPAEVRTRMGISSGSIIMFDACAEDTYTIKAYSDDPLNSLKGILRCRYPRLSIEETDVLMAQAIADDYLESIE